MTKKERKIIEQGIKCLYCRKPMIVTVKSETVKPGVKAETEKTIELKKDTQPRLGSG